MKYKIVIVNYSNEDDPDISIFYDSDNRCVEWENQRLLFFMLKKQWENGEGWFALKLYGVHIFETDNLETFDLLEAQRLKDEPARQIHLELEANKYIDTAPMQRKAEIRRIAEQLWIHDGNNNYTSYENIIKCAISIYDNFDAEFEKLEKGE